MKLQYDSAHIKDQVIRKWNTGAFLRGEVDFPFRIPLSFPAPLKILGLHKADLWKQELVQKIHLGYRLEMKRVDTRLHGSNEFPVAAYVDSIEDVLRMLKAKEAYDKYQALLVDPQTKALGLEAWLKLNPFKAIDHYVEWRLILAAVDWLVEHPTPNMYLRQVSIPGVHTKFIEKNAVVIESMVRAVAPNFALQEGRDFVSRFGFITEEPMVTLRFLDDRLRPFPDLSMMSAPASHLRSLKKRVKRVFVTENKVNFLAFPDVSDSVILFGKGYSFDSWQHLSWIHEAENLYYWGDLDTHGFSILNQFRGPFPQAKSFLMNRSTLLAHQHFFVEEPLPIHANLERLTSEELALYQEFLPGGLYTGQRLEQERIQFDFVNDSVRTVDMWEILESTGKLLEAESAGFK